MSHVWGTSQKIVGEKRKYFSESSLAQSFSTLVFLTFEARSFVVMGGCPVHWRMLSSTPGLHSLMPEANHYLPILTTKMSPDTAKVFWGGSEGILPVKSIDSTHLYKLAWLIVVNIIKLFKSLYSSELILLILPKCCIQIFVFYHNRLTNLEWLLFRHRNY